MVRNVRFFFLLWRRLSSKFLSIIVMFYCQTKNKFNVGVRESRAYSYKTPRACRIVVTIVSPEESHRSLLLYYRDYRLIILMTVAQICKHMLLFPCVRKTSHLYAVIHKFVACRSDSIQIENVFFFFFFENAFLLLFFSTISEFL